MVATMTAAATEYVVCFQYVGSGVVSELDSPDATRLAIAKIREVSLTTASNCYLEVITRLFSYRPVYQA